MGDGATQTPSGRSRLRRVAEGGGLNLAASAVSAALTLGLTSMVAKSLDQSSAGVFFAMTSLILIGVSLAEFGSEASMSRFLPVALDQGRVNDARGILALGILITSAVGSAIAVLILVWSTELLSLVQSPAGPEPSGTEELALIAAVVVPVAALGRVLLSATRGFSTIVPTAVGDKVVRPALQLALVGVAASSGGVAAFLLGWSIPYAVVLVLGAVSIVRLMADRSSRSTQDTERMLLRRLALVYASYTGPRAVASLLQSIMQRADIIVVASLRGPRDAAVYAVVTRIVVFGQFLGQAIQQVLAPHLSSLLAAYDRQATSELVRATTAWSVLATWPIYLLAIVSAPSILTLLGGASYSRQDATLTLAIISVAMLVAKFLGPVDTLLLMAGRSSLSLAISTVATAANLLLLILLVPDLGVLGAGISWAVAVLIRNLLNWFAAWKSTGVTAWGKPVVTAALIACVSFVAVPALLRAWIEPRDGWQVVGFVGGVLVYSWLLYLRRDVLRLGVLVPERLNRRRDRETL